MSEKWHWRDRYDFGEHLKNRDKIMEIDCDNHKMGRIQLVDDKGDIILEEWASCADDGGLTISDEHAALICAAPLIPECEDGIKKVLELVGESHGISGFHLNGDLALWDEFEDDLLEPLRALLTALKDARGSDD